MGPILSPQNNHIRCASNLLAFHPQTPYAPSNSLEWSAQETTGPQFHEHFEPSRLQAISKCLLGAALVEMGPHRLATNQVRHQTGGEASNLSMPIRAWHILFLFGPNEPLDAWS